MSWFEHIENKEREKSIDTAIKTLWNWADSARSLFDSNIDKMVKSEDEVAYWLAEEMFNVQSPESIVNISSDEWGQITTKFWQNKLTKLLGNLDIETKDALRNHLNEINTNDGRYTIQNALNLSTTKTSPKKNEWPSIANDFRKIVWRMFWKQ